MNRLIPHDASQKSIALRVLLLTLLSLSVFTPVKTTWTEDTSVGSTKEWIGITSSSDGTKLAATVFEGNIWTSTDSGATWTEDTSVGSTKDWHLITSSSDGTKLAATVFGGNIWTFEAPSPCTCCQENMIKMGLNIGGECTVQT